MGHNYSAWDKLIHAGLALFGVAAYLTAEAAEGSRGSFGYLLHAYLGLTAATFIGLRLLGGMFGRPAMRFSGWSPFRPAAWREAAEDLISLARLHLPERDMHQGIAGLVQFLGLALFAWMSATGVVLYVFTGKAYHGVHELAEEAHEIGESLIPLFLLAHVGAVAAHSLLGSPVWQRMFGRQSST